MKIDDSALAAAMARAQAGDAAAYRRVLTDAERWLRRYYARRTAPASIDDLVQETLVSLHAKRATYDPARPFLPWLAAIARYRWVDALRRRYRSEAELTDDDAAIVDSFEAEVAARISLDRLFERLPPRQAEVIRLVKIDGLSIAEAAARSGQSESLVKVNIHRGLKRLATIVETGV